MGARTWQLPAEKYEDDSGDDDEENDDIRREEFCRCEDCGYASVVPRRCPRCGGRVE